MEFVISIPAGPNFDPRMKYTFESLRVQTAKVRIALCDVSDDPRCHALAESYSELIDYTRHGPDTGQSEAINEGWRAIDGDIYGWLNADDFLAPGALAHVERVFTENPEIDVVYGQSIITHGATFIGLHSEVRQMSHEILRSNIISQPSCFVRAKALFETGLLNEGLHYTMDWDLWVRLYEAGANFYYHPKVLSAVSWDKDTKTASFNRMRYQELVKLTRRHATWFEAQRTALSFFIEHASQYGFAQGIFKRITKTVRARSKRPERRWVPNERRVYNGRGGATREVSIPIFHYMSHSQYAVDAVLLSSCNWEISIMGVKAAFIDQNAVRLNVEILPGMMCDVCIRTGDENLSNLISLTLMPL